jgi:hypothetical protein
MKMTVPTLVGTVEVSEGDNDDMAARCLSS